jgi:hypothetical protein
MSSVLKGKIIPHIFHPIVTPLIFLGAYFLSMTSFSAVFNGRNAGKTYHLSQIIYVSK